MLEIIHYTSICCKSFTERTLSTCKKYICGMGLILSTTSICWQECVIRWGVKMKRNNRMVQDIYLKFPRLTRINDYNKPRQDIWRWNLPNKLKCFWWLLAHDHILTWNNLQKHRFIGPRICPLCMEGHIDHFFINFSYGRMIWDGVIEELKLLFLITN